MEAGRDGHGADDASSSLGIYRPVTHWDRPAIVHVAGEDYPCRLIGTVVGRYGTEDGAAGKDLGDRIWAAEALGLPAELDGDVMVTVSGATLVKARVRSGRLSGVGVPWLDDGESSPMTGSGQIYQLSRRTRDGVLRWHREPDQSLTAWNEAHGVVLVRSDSGGVRLVLFSGSEPVIFESGEQDTTDDLVVLWALADAHADPD